MRDKFVAVRLEIGCVGDARHGDKALLVFGILLGVAAGYAVGNVCQLKRVGGAYGAGGVAIRLVTEKKQALIEPKNAV